MSDNKTYYYVKIKENFYDSDEMILLESMPDGYIYSNILLKLYLRSLKNNGKLMLNDKIPYNDTMLASITRHTVGNVKQALQIFKELALIEILDNGAIYVNHIQNFIGKSSTEADRKREYRLRIEADKKALEKPKRQKSDKCPDKNPPEIEKELEINILEDEEEEETLKKYIIELSKDEIKFQEVLSDFMDFITMGDQSQIKNRFIYSENLKNKLLNYDKRTIQNFKTFLNNQEVVAWIKQGA